MGNKKLTYILFGIYAVMLVWLVLFKLKFSFDQLDRVRVINLIPLNQSVFSEVYNNVRIFVPLGIYIGMLKSNWSLAKKMGVIIGFTFAFEAIQYVFAIGRSDVTDLLANTLGGVIGLGIYQLLLKILKHRTNAVINIFVLVFTALIVFFVLFVFRRH